MPSPPTHSPVQNGVGDVRRRVAESARRARPRVERRTEIYSSRDLLTGTGTGAGTRAWEGPVCERVRGSGALGAPSRSDEAISTETVDLSAERASACIT